MSALVECGCCRGDGAHYTRIDVDVERRERCWECRGSGRVDEVREPSVCDGAAFSSDDDAYERAVARAMEG